MGNTQISSVIACNSKKSKKSKVKISEDIQPNLDNKLEPMFYHIKLSDAKAKKQTFKLSKKTNDKIWNAKQDYTVAIRCTDCNFISISQHMYQCHLLNCTGNASKESQEICESPMTSSSYHEHNHFAVSHHCSFCSEEIHVDSMADYKKHLMKECESSPYNKRCKFCFKLLTPRTLESYTNHLVHECKEYPYNKDKTQSTEEPTTNINETDSNSNPQIESCQKECPICFDELKTSEATFLPCCHKFHGDCINAWGKKRDYCPVCMTKFRAVKK